MWNAAGATLAKMVWLSQEYPYHTFGTGTRRVIVHPDGIQIGDSDIVNWDDLNEPLLHQCVQSILPDTQAIVVVLPDLLMRMRTWSDVSSISNVGELCNTKILRVVVRKKVHTLVAYPCNAPILFITDDDFVRFIINTSCDWYHRATLTADSLGVISTTSKLGWGYTGSVVLSTDQWSDSDVIDFFNEGKPESMSDIIGEKMYKGIWDIIHQDGDSVEKYRVLVGALRCLDEDLPDTLDVILQADKETKDR